MMLGAFVVEWMCFFLFPHTDECEVPVSPVWLPKTRAGHMLERTWFRAASTR